MRGPAHREGEHVESGCLGRVCGRMCGRSGRRCGGFRPGRARWRGYRRRYWRCRGGGRRGHRRRTWRRMEPRRLTNLETSSQAPAPHAGLGPEPQAMAAIVAKRSLERLARSSFVVMKQPPAVGGTAPPRAPRSPTIKPRSRRLCARSDSPGSQGRRSRGAPWPRSTVRGR